MQVLQLQAGKAPVYVYMHARTDRACTCQARTIRDYAGGQDPGAMMWPYMCVHIYTGHAPTRAMKMQARLRCMCTPAYMYMPRICVPSPSKIQGRCYDIQSSSTATSTPHMIKPTAYPDDDAEEV
jgi:hypothetical protein